MLPNPEHIFFNQSSCCLHFTRALLEVPIATCSTFSCCKLGDFEGLRGSNEGEEHCMAFS